LSKPFTTLLFRDISNPSQWRSSARVVFIILPSHPLHDNGNRIKLSGSKRILTRTHNPNPDVMAREEMTWNIIRDFRPTYYYYYWNTASHYYIVILSYLLVDCHRRHRVRFSSGLQGSRPKVNNIIYNALTYITYTYIYIYIYRVHHICILRTCKKLLPTSRLRLHSTGRGGLTATQCGKKEIRNKKGNEKK